MWPTTTVRTKRTRVLVRDWILNLQTPTQIRKRTTVRKNFLLRYHIRGNLLFCLIIVDKVFVILDLKSNRHHEVWNTHHISHELCVNTLFTIFPKEDRQDLIPQNWRFYPILGWMVTQKKFFLSINNLNKVNKRYLFIEIIQNLKKKSLTTLFPCLHLYYIYIETMGQIFRLKDWNKEGPVGKFVS